MRFVVTGLFWSSSWLLTCNAFVAPVQRVHFQKQQQQQRQQQQSTGFNGFKLQSTVEESEDSETTAEAKIVDEKPRFPEVNEFDLDTALFCGGLAFDAYTEPPQDSSRWERGSKGMNVAFLSTSFTRHLYKGLVEVTPIQCSGLPDEDDTVEAVMTGGGVDASLLVAAVEGHWTEDIEMVRNQYHEGVMDLSGSAHVGRSRTAWSNVNENKSKAEKKKTGKALPYHIPSGWGRDAKAVWADEDPFYLYVQDPANVRLVFTIFDDDVVGQGSPVGSTYALLSDLLPPVKYSQSELVDNIKQEIINKVKNGKIDPQNVDEEIAKAVNASAKAWEGDLKLNSKPRIKDKKGQVAIGMAAGAMVAGPLGAAVGGALGNMYEGQIKGRVTVRLRYLPIPTMETERKRYSVLGGLPGVNWGQLYEKYLANRIGIPNEGEDLDLSLIDANIAGNDLEHCFFINHDVTGACCAVYRSLQKKLIVVTFRGTCMPVDLLTDASIVQEPWVEGEEDKGAKNGEEIAKVHVGFRRSMNSISRRLKELILATVAPGDDISEYDMLVTGHSLGGALATTFIADVGEFGIDAGRALPQKQPSDDWWKALSNTIMGKEQVGSAAKREPPRPKSLRLYNFGSPRVGNRAFAKRFDQLLQDGRIDQAYRLVNGQDIVTRLPRTMYTLSIDYDHCGKTVLINELDDDDGNIDAPLVWIEGESDNALCPVRDSFNRMSNPLSSGNLLGDLFSATQKEEVQGAATETEQETLFSKMSKRLSSVTASDIASIVGIDRNFSEREMKIVQSFVKGQALAHHMEDSYYAAMGRAGGFVAKVGEDIQKLEQ